jgi:hypothetical protein
MNNSSLAVQSSDIALRFGDSGKETLDIFGRRYSPGLRRTRPMKLVDRNVASPKSNTYLTSLGDDKIVLPDVGVTKTQLLVGKIDFLF